MCTIAMEEPGYVVLKKLPWPARCFNQLFFKPLLVYIQSTLNQTVPVIPLQLTNSFWCAKSVLSVDACDRIVRLGDERNKRESKIPDEDPDRKIRRSMNAWLNRGRSNKKYDWIYDQLTRHVLRINNRLWQWNLHRFEPFQYTVYSSDDHYTWHADQKRTVHDRHSPWAGLTRKVTVVVQLSDPCEYEGGQFEIEVLNAGPGDEDKRIARPDQLRYKGAAIVFPSFLYHRVTNVTSGTRKSLVGWCLGPAFY